MLHRANGYSFFPLCALVRTFCLYPVSIRPGRITRQRKTISPQMLQIGERETGSTDIPSGLLWVIFNEDTLLLWTVDELSDERSFVSQGTIPLGFSAEFGGEIVGATYADGCFYGIASPTMRPTPSTPWPALRIICIPDPTIPGTVSWNVPLSDSLDPSSRTACVHDGMGILLFHLVQGIGGAQNTWHARRITDLGETAVTETDLGVVRRSGNTERVVVAGACLFKGAVIRGWAIYQRSLYSFLITV